MVEKKTILITTRWGTVCPYVVSLSYNMGYRPELLVDDVRLNSVLL